MKTFSGSLLETIGLSLCAFTGWNAVNWEVKEDIYSIRFDTKGASGVIRGLKGTMRFDQSDPAESMFDVTVDVNSLTTGNGMKNHHARGEGFLDAGKYPTIHFISSRVEKSAAGYLVTGKLTIKATTKDISIPFTFEQRENEGIFKGDFKINRTDYDLNRKGVGEVINMELSVPVKK